ncbi:MAG: hypothetical protein EP310_10105 [Bacteroidetes bacterium]|nr:MAG: hypothetical protein EP310_10105 [Bacteroidota bacterium]
MKTFSLIVFLFGLNIKFGFSQTFPNFLPGTWKVENSEKYEHWDKISENCMMGFSYEIKNGKMTVSEYLEIKKNGDEIVYSATVIGQNSGNTVGFTQTHSDTVFLFENPGHDFPKFIRYKPLSGNQIQVTVGAGENSFSFGLQKIE